MRKLADLPWLMDGRARTLRRENTFILGTPDREDYDTKIALRHHGAQFSIALDTFPSSRRHEFVGVPRLAAWRAGIATVRKGAAG